MHNFIRSNTISSTCASGFVLFTYLSFYAILHYCLRIHYPSNLNQMVLLQSRIIRKLTMLHMTLTLISYLRSMVFNDYKY